MEYKQFITGFKNSKDKEAYAKKHVKVSYVPYADKLTEAKKIADIATHVEINGKKVYKKNTPIQYYLTTVRILMLYTDITSEGNDIEMYDQLVSTDAITPLFSHIPESELAQFKAMIDMCVSDIYENERDLVSFLETKIEAIGLTTDTIIQSLSEVISKNEETKEVGNNVVDFPMNPPLDAE